MKTNKLIKAFIPYAITNDVAAWCAKATRNPDAAAEAVKNFIAKDPDDHEWSSMGLIEPLAQNSLVHDLDGAAYLLMYQIAERKLPASVRDEEVGKRFKELSDREGRPLNKKEYAQLKEDVESALLPQAFIVRKFVPVLVTKDTLLVCTSSASQCEKILGHLVRMFETRKVTFEFTGHQFALSYGEMLAQLARDDMIDLGNTYPKDSALHAGTSAKFKGEDKRTITVKDRDLQSDEIMAVTHDASYAVTELRMSLEMSGETVSEFTMTDKFIVKGFKLTDISLASVSEADADDLYVTYWLLAKELLRTLSALSFALNAGHPPMPDEAADDDEL